MSDEKEELADNQARVLEMISDRKERLEEIRALEEPLRNLLKEWQVDTAVAIEVCISKAAAQKFLEVEVPAYRIVSPASDIGKALRSMGLAPAYNYIRERLDYLNDLAIEIERIPLRHLGHMQDSQGQPGSTTPVQTEEAATDVSDQKMEPGYKEFEYKCKDKIEIPGTRPEGGSNHIKVNGIEMSIGERPFELFLRFVEELVKNAGGWISVSTLTKEGFLTDKTNHMKIERVRKPFRGYLLNKGTGAHLSLIENDRARNFRLSTHPDLVTYDKDKLMKHPEPVIQDIASRLPFRL